MEKDNSLTEIKENKKYMDDETFRKLFEDLLYIYIAERLRPLLKTKEEVAEMEEYLSEICTWEENIKAKQEIYLFWKERFVNDTIFAAMKESVGELLGSTEEVLQSRFEEKVSFYSPKVVQ